MNSNQPIKFLVISGSLRPGSRSRILAQALEKELSSEEARLIDLRDFNLPICDGGDVYDNPSVQKVAGIVEEADGIILATPVYNYGVSASVKNLVELTGDAWTGKVVGLVVAAGGMGSYMAAMPFLNSLMLDFHSFILPRFVYASGRAFKDGEIIDDDVQARLAALGGELIRVTRALRGER